MNLFRKYFLFVTLFLSFLFIQNEIFAQREVILTRKLTLNCPGLLQSIDHCTYGLLVPASRPGKQEVIKYSFPSLKPHHFNKTEDNQSFLVWQNVSFADIDKAGLEVVVKIKLFKYDLTTAKKHPVKDTADTDTLSYLKDEENFRTKAKNIKEVAEMLTGGDREEIVRKIFNYTKNNLDYHIFFDQDRGAKKALKEGRGDCTEYSELMVTLCRAKKIPARIVMGLIPKSDGDIGHHNWVEVYFPEYGWVAFDPTWADHVKATTTFYSMKNTYVELSNKRYPKSFFNPCETSSLICSSKLLDTCIDLSLGITSRIKEMHTYYNNFELAKAGVIIDSLLVHEPDNYSFWIFRGMIYARQGDFEKGLPCIENAAKISETSFEKNKCSYALSNLYALKNDSVNAVKYLKEALSLGMENYEHILNDPDFKKIKNYPPFVELLNELKAKKDAVKKED